MISGDQPSPAPSTLPFTLISHMHHNLPGLQCHGHKPHPVEKPIPSKLLIRKGHIFNLASLNFKTQLFVTEGVWCSSKPLALSIDLSFLKPATCQRLSLHTPVEFTQYLVSSQVICCPWQLNRNNYKNHHFPSKLFNFHVYASYK